MKVKAFTLRTKAEMRNLLVLAIVNLWTTMGASYTVKYFDCNEPVAVTTYQHMTACEHQQDKVDCQPETYRILQKNSTQRLKGYSCTISRSSIVHYCGAYSHSKIAEPPEIEIPESISKENCQRLVRQQSFRTPDC